MGFSKTIFTSSFLLWLLACGYVDARVQVNPKAPNYSFTPDQMEALLQASRAYLRAVSPAILVQPKMDIFNAIPNWKSTNDLLANEKLIDDVIAAGKKSAEKYKDQLADLEAKRLEANRKAKEKGIRIVNTGILKKGNELCKKLADLNEKSPLCR